MRIQFRRLNSVFLMSLISIVCLLHVADVGAQPAMGFIRIRIENLRNGNGQVAVSVFDAKSAKGFPDQAESAVEKIVIPLHGQNEIEFLTKPLPAGQYAVALLHDENSDHQFNTNFLGYPKEGFGFSNNPRVYFGPPSIEKTLIDHSSENGELVIRVRYF